MSVALLEQDGLSVMNVGLESFTRSVTERGGQALQLDWQPPGDADASRPYRPAAEVSNRKGGIRCIGSSS